MITPTFKEEQKLSKKGCQFIVGLDEAGRGPLAGPVVAAAVIFSPRAIKLYSRKVNSNSGEKSFWFKSVRDSKTLTSKKREELYKIIVKEALDWKVGAVSEKMVDKINILQASFLAMKKAVKKLKTRPDFLLIDGKFTLTDYPVNQKAIPQGDQKIFSIAAASIVAKVTRDRVMKNLHKKYPLYSFDKHKGYGTRLHFEMLDRHGPCQIHRKSFKPVKKLIT